MPERIAAVGAMKQLMADYFYELDAAAKDPEQKVAWCTSVGPAELLRAFGFAVYFPENHGAMLGATRMATDLIPMANALGYSPDICSYLTSDIGSYVKGETPLTKAYPGIEGVPKPDLLVYNTNQCRDVKDWFSWYAREFKAPIMGIETHRGVGTVEESHVDSVAAQMKGLVPELERITGMGFDSGRLREVVGSSAECSRLWSMVLNSAASRPAPINFFDGTIHMGPAVVLRGDPRAVEYYQLLLEEMGQRIDGNIGAVDDEQVRLYWEGMPVWGRLSTLAKLLNSLNTCVVASTYCNSWVFDFDPRDAFNSMARAYTELFIVRSDEEKERYIIEMADRFGYDGIIYHDSKTCPNNTNSRYAMPGRLEKELGLPYMVLHGDLNDLRCYSDENARLSIEAFVEQLKE